MALLIACLAIAAWSTPARAQAPSFIDADALATDTGHILLSWEADGPVTLSIAQTADLADARPLYEGSESSYFLSGLADGDYYLVLEDAGGVRSEPVQLAVAHQSLAQALWLTLIGIIITLGIIVTILKGQKDGGPGDD